jgi:hypothetical protein
MRETAVVGLVPASVVGGDDEGERTVTDALAFWRCEP